MSSSENADSLTGEQQREPISDQGGLSQAPAESQTQQHPNNSAPPSTGNEPGQSVFSRAHIKKEVKLLLVMYASIGVGVGGSALSVLSQLNEEQMLVLGGVIVPATIALMFFVPPVIGAIMAIHIDWRISESGKDLYLMTGGSVFVGSVVFMIVTTAFLGIEVNTGIGVQSMIVPFVAAAIPAAVAAVGVSWCVDTPKSE